MSQTDDHHDSGSSATPELSTATISELLQCGLASPPRAVDHLIAYLEQHDAAVWLREALDDFADDTRQISPEAICLLPLERLEKIKHDGKSRFQMEDVLPQKCAELLKYYLAIAAATVGYGAHISSLPAVEFASLFVDLAEAIPAPWEGVFRDAAMKMSG